MMNIKEAARVSRLPAKTIRYYEEIGLVRVERAGNGYRRFEERDVRKLAFVGRARDLGFSVADCCELLALYEDRSLASGDVERIAEAMLARIEAKRRDLDALRRALAQLRASCQTGQRPDCPLLEDLEGRMHPGRGCRPHQDTDALGCCAGWSPSTKPATRAESTSDRQRPR